LRRPEIIKKRIISILMIFLILIVLFTVLIPFFWTFITSVAPAVDIHQRPPKWIPTKISFKYYIDIFTSSKKAFGVSYEFKRGILNSMIVSIFVTVIALFFGSLAAYSVVRLKIPFGKFITLFILLTQMMPPVILIIPLYFIASKLNMFDRKVSLILIYLAFNLPLAIWILEGYFKSIPVSIEESALIDGCSRLQSLFRVLLPLSGPALFTTGIFVFIASWNEFLMALVFTSSLTAKTMPVAIAEFIGRFTTDYGLMATAGILGSMPPLIFAAIFQRYLISGITAGSVKG
jgi:multiple sugar transport system permease protein